MPERVTELHSIMPIANIASVLEHGILSHRKVATLDHRDVSLASVQDKRASKKVPNGLNLHQYANLYFCARNPMMYRRQDEANNLCVLRISHKVIHLKGVVLTDRNAANKYVRFLSVSDYEQINFDWVFARYWTDNDEITQRQKKAAKCAEVLVPGKIEPQYITGAYVVSDAAKTCLQQQGFDKGITINTQLFFR